MTLHSHWQCMRVPLFLYPHQHLIESIFFILTTIKYEWYLICLKQKSQKLIFNVTLTL